MLGVFIAEGRSWRKYTAYNTHFYFVLFRHCHCKRCTESPTRIERTRCTVNTRVRKCHDILDNIENVIIFSLKLLSVIYIIDIFMW